MPRQSFMTLYTVSLLAPVMGMAANPTVSESQSIPPLSNETPPTLPPQEWADPVTEFDVTKNAQRKTTSAVENNTLTETQPNHDASDSSQTLSLSKAELAQQPELLYRALASSVRLKNIEGIRTLLPIYQQQPDPKDTVLIDLATALVARADGKAGKAAQHYQKVLEKQPNLASVKLGLAQSLFDDKQNKAADEAFAKIEAEPDLPKEVQELTQSYRKILKKRRKFNFYANANYTRDNNINNAPETRVIKTRNGEWKMPEPKRAQGFAYRAGMSKDTPLFKNYQFRTNVDLWGKFYWDNHAYDDLSARVSAGLVYENVRSELSVQPYYERRWFGTEKYATEKGGRVEASHWFNPKNQMIVAGELGRDTYDTRKFLNGRTANVSGTLVHLHNKNQYFTIGADLSRKSAVDGSDAYRRKGLRATWSRTWKRTGFSTILTANYGQRSYDAHDFFNIVRKDKEYTATLSIWHKKVQLWGIQPRLVGVYHRNDSNHFLYDYRKAYAFVQLSKSFK